jgi:16S rRNA (uracil1498-N3)-methyltransferase
LKFNQKDILFYSPQKFSTPIELNKEESIHCLKVMRLNINDEINVTNGFGEIARCKIITPSTKLCNLEIIKISNIQNIIGQKIHIAISPTKNINRFEWFIEKVVELGVREITPIISQRTERNKLNFERINKKMITALKQSYNANLPKLNPFETFSNFIKTENNDQKIICHNENNNISLLKNQIEKDNNYTILIGPEGGFTNEEVILAEKNNFRQMLLGNSKYRTETAGILACHTIHLFA